MQMQIRQPIVTVLGHVDHGKTTLLDSIRASKVASGEIGLITQHIGASEIPIKDVKKICGSLLQEMKVKIEISGLLFIDTPGHEAFTTLRKRGGSIADLAILVIDINEGVMPQTEESIRFLKEFHTPFVVALTKIDKLAGWQTKENACFYDSFNQQPKYTQDELEKRLYYIIGQLAKYNFEAERCDRVKDFAKELCIVPVSGLTGEGIADLLVVLAGLAQRYLKDRLTITSSEGKGTVLEVKEFRGLGVTTDVILYDGGIKVGDWLVIGSKELAVTKVKALLKPKPMHELRVERIFLPVQSVTAACGIKIAAPSLDKIIAGSPLRAVRGKEQIETAKKEVKQEIAEVEIYTDKEGFILKADTLGSLEALIKTLRELGLSIRKAEVGSVLKQDIIEARSLKQPLIFAFGVKVLEDANKLAKDFGIKIFQSEVIYKLLEEYQEWERGRKIELEKQLLASAVRPGQIKILPGYVFRASKPAVFGVEVLKGTIKPKYKLKKNEKIIGEIKELQSEGKNIKEAKIGDKVAVSIEGVTVGRQIKENDILEVFLTQANLDLLQKIRNKLRSDEIELLDELKEE